MNRTDPSMPRSMGTWARRELLHLLALTGQLWRVNFTVRADVGGQRVKIPVLYGQGPQNLALLEPGLMGAFERLFAMREGAFCDVGVNVGQTLLKVKALDALRRYVGFEINPRCCQYVEELIRINRFEHCTVIPAGLAERNGLTTLFLRSNVSLDPSATSVEAIGRADASLRRQYAIVCRGDDVIAPLNFDRLAMIKIDTEGGELEVLEGIAETVRRFRPFIVCEILPVGDLRTAGGKTRLSRQRALEALLRAWSYQVFRLHDDTRLQRIVDIGVHDDLALSNYVFVPRELEEQAVQRFELITAA